MRKVPVVFSIDRNVVVPFTVCVTSLLEHARPDTFYELFVLCDGEELGEELRNEARRAELASENCSLAFVDVGGAFAEAYEIRGITVATYYRLLMPDLFPAYERMIYADVDMIFRSDLADLYEQACAGGELVAGVREWNDFLHDETTDRDKEYLRSIGCGVETYVNGGFLVMNLGAMRREGIVARFLEHADRQYTFQDQDIINVVCRGRIELLPMRWNYTYTLYRWAHTGPAAYIKAYGREIDEAEWRGTVHYTGPKPWKKFCPRYDCWWACYRRSAAFDAEFSFRAQEAVCRAQDEARNVPRPSKWKRLRRRVCRAFGYKKSYWE